ncbi:MAG: TIGR03862 family flavoprotein [Planctomycetota bacterium]|jgi:uncharacterized flavoprotein (TIGR03862 family)
MDEQWDVVVVGGGPAGLMAAEHAARAGARVLVAEAQAGCGRKLLVAGHSGLNLTHAEDSAAFLGRYGAASTWMAPHLAAFDAAATRAWAAELGVETFVGSSGRVFPTAMKAAELRQAWLDRLAALGVEVRCGWSWTGVAPGPVVRFATETGGQELTPAACVLALGGASWPQTGSTGTWTDLLTEHGVAILPWQPANCGFEVSWSAAMTRFAGSPLKNVALRCAGATSVGECVLTSYGVEGQAVYALGAAPREEIIRHGHAVLEVDLCRDRSVDEVAARVAVPRGKRSLSDHLRRRLGLRGPAYSLLREVGTDEVWADPQRLAALIKAVPLRLERPRPLDEAISSAGGVAIGEVDAQLMLRRLPGVYVAGEMLDWEAPTGGYLLQGCFATGAAAGRAAAHRRLADV